MLRNVRIRREPLLMFVLVGELLPLEYTSETLVPLFQLPPK